MPGLVTIQLCGECAFQGIEGCLGGDGDSRVAGSPVAGCSDHPRLLG